MLWYLFGYCVCRIFFEKEKIMTEWEKEIWDEIFNCNQDKISECERLLKIVKREIKEFGNDVIKGADGYLDKLDFSDQWKERGIK